jgi:hypothetical protein
MSMGHEAKLHSPPGRAHRRRGVPRLAQHRSFRGAAADLGVTPSAIGLTEAGERFLARAKPT